MEVSATNTKIICSTLKKLNVNFSFYDPFREEYKESTQRVFMYLYEKGIFIKKTIEINYCYDCDQYLYEGFVLGECPYCLNTCQGGIVKSAAYQTTQQILNMLHVENVVYPQ